MHCIPNLYKSWIYGFRKVIMFRVRTEWDNPNALTCRSKKSTAHARAWSWLAVGARHGSVPEGLVAVPWIELIVSWDCDPTDHPTTNPSPTVWQCASLLLTAPSLTVPWLPGKTKEKLDQSRLGLRWSTCHMTRYKLWNNLCRRADNVFHQRSSKSGRSWLDRALVGEVGAVKARLKRKMNARRWQSADNALSLCST